MREKWWYPSWREVLFGIAAGWAANELWLRRNLRAFSDAVERGDMDAAQRFARRAYLTDLLVWLRRPPRDDDAEEEA